MFFFVFTYKKATKNVEVKVDVQRGPLRFRFFLTINVQKLGGCTVLTCTSPRECTGGVLIWTLPYYVHIQ